jgi:ABC-type branched-subunit amino acid transport system substrate-binding protein
VLRTAGAISCIWLLAISGLASACGPIALTRPVTKIGLVAPFEGEQRPVGYEALYAVKLALREQNERDGAAGWNVELVALDTSNHVDLAFRQALALAVDSDVVFAVSISEPASRALIQAQFAKLNIPAIVISFPTTTTAQPDPNFVDRYRAVSGGITPGELAMQTYAVTRQGLNQLAMRIQTAGKPER